MQFVACLIKLLLEKVKLRRFDARRIGETVSTQEDTFVEFDWVGCSFTNIHFEVGTTKSDSQDEKPANFAPNIRYFLLFIFM